MDPENLPGVNKRGKHLSLNRIAMRGIARKIMLWVGIPVSAVFLYVWLINWNSENMTTRQKIMRAIYPVFTGIQRLTGAQARAYAATPERKTLAPIGDMRFRMNDGTEQSMQAYRGKKVLVVNTASDCGYTGQYAELQDLQDMYPDKLVVIGFPANDFKEQEKGDDASIAAFCKLNYGVRFPIASKASVIKGPGQHPVFQWLSDSSRNGWNARPPSWNFMKYLLDEEGRLIGVFEPAADPKGKDIRQMIDS
jgi:glutathione peroxidase